MAIILMMACMDIGLALAQQEVLEYRWDIGGGAGVCYYMGDANGTPFSGSSFMAAFMLRRDFNPRMALKMNLAYGRYGGSTQGYYIPEEPGTTEQSVDLKFNGNVVDIGAQFELNFWGYGMGPGYKRLSRITPYAILGIGDRKSVV